MISQEYKVIKNCKKKDSLNAKNNKADANANGNANSKVNDLRCPPHNKKHCNVCRKDGHKTDDCHYKDMDLCNECKKYGHLTKECWGKDGKKCPYKGKEKENNKRKKESHNTETEDEKEAQTNNAQVQTGKFKKGEDITLLAEEKNNVDDKDSNMAAINNYGTIASSSKMTDSLYYWLADLGTTSHITHQQDAFRTYEPIKHILILGIGGIRTHAIGKGTIVLHSEVNGYIHTLCLNDVLHVPNNKNNLFSIGCWEEQLQWQEA